MIPWPYFISMEVEEAVMTVTLIGGLAGATNNAHTITSLTKKKFVEAWKAKRLNIEMPTSEFNWHQLLAFYSSTTLLLRSVQER